MVFHQQRLAMSGHVLRCRMGFAVRVQTLLAPLLWYHACHQIMDCKAEDAMYCTNSLSCVP